MPRNLRLDFRLSLRGHEWVHSPGAPGEVRVATDRSGPGRGLQSEEVAVAVPSPRRATAGPSRHRARPSGELPPPSTQGFGASRHRRCAQVRLDRVRRRVPGRARQAGQARRLRQDGPPLPRVRAPQGVVVLPGGRRLRRPDPGGPGRPLQGDPRLPARPRVELPELRRALHHPPDHHRRQDGDPQQAHAAQLLRVVQPDAGGRRARRASRPWPTCCRARPSTTR